MKIGMQLWGLRDALAADYAAAIAEIAKIGYQGVELFGDHLPASQTKAILDQHGLEAAGHHFVYQQLEANVDACIERTQTLGASVVVCAWSKATPEYGWDKIGDGLERIANACHATGLKFAYHNHDHELLETLNGVKALDVLATRSPSTALELDIAWLHAGGVNPPEYVKAHASRTILAHIKDVAKSGEGWQTVELGQGSVPLAATLEAVKQTQTPWLLVEQDNSDDPWRSARNNFAWLKANS